MADKKRAKQVSEMSDEELLGFSEPGLEEEVGPVDMIKPFKKAAIAKAGMEGTPTGNALDLAVPDSPLILANQAGSAMKGIGKFMGMMPKAGKVAAASKVGDEVRAARKLGEEASVAGNLENSALHYTDTSPGLRDVFQENATKASYKPGMGATGDLMHADVPNWKKKLMIRKPNAVR